MLKKLKSFFCKEIYYEKSVNLQKEKFNQVMSIAKQINSNNHDSLNDLIKLLARPYQSNAMNHVLTTLNENEIKEVNSKELFFCEFEKIPYLNKSLNDLKSKSNYSKPLELKTDIILPWPWNQSRIVQNLLYIGVNRPAGSWKEDNTNHKIEYWLPIGIGFVHGGNHSITNGIINGTGVIHNYSAYDISEIYKFIYCDGEYYYNAKDNTKFQKVNNLEFACIFEIGRLMVDFKNIMNPKN